MSEKGSSKSLSLWFQILSLLGLVLIPLVIFRTIIEPPDLISQTQFVGLIFIGICLLGAVAGVRPSSFSRSKPSKSMEKDADDSQETEALHRKPALRGHHRSCEPFSDHVLRIGNRVFCAGCTGLTTGALIAILGSIVYFLFGISFINELVAFWMGFTGVFVGLVQHRLYRVLSIRNGFLRFALNVFFVLGAFLLLVGANQLANSLAVDLYVLCVILLWITNRIMMSSSEHEKICLQCNIESCSHPH